jgi:sodium/potassium-transporting ATPase subunit alpha
MANFKNFLPDRAFVYRGGEQIAISAEDIVPGDIVEVESRDKGKIPADIILIYTNEMKVDNSSLTGESEHLPRFSEKTKDNVFETPNVAFFGTTCTGGMGVGIVFKTGDNTVIG